MRRLAVFASGSGTNFEAIVTACERGVLDAEVVLMEYGVKVFGVTIHYVDAELDGGRIIAQRAFPYEGDDIGELEAMIHAVEYPLYIETIKKLIE